MKPGFHSVSGAVVTRLSSCSPRRVPASPSERDDASMSRPIDGVVAGSSPPVSPRGR